MSQVSAVENDDLDAQIGERVHHLMWRNRISQTAMAPHLGVSQSVLSRKLRGVVTWTARDLVAVASVLGASIDELVPGWSPQVVEPPRPADDASEVATGRVELPTFRFSVERSTN